MAPSSSLSSAPIARKGFYEYMAMSRLPDQPNGAAASTQGRSIERFVSHQPPWMPGFDLPIEARSQSAKGAFGGHAYIQAALAAARAVEEKDKHSSNEKSLGKLGIHTIQGIFNLPGRPDRPFVYEVTEVASGKSFSANVVNARQPLQPSSEPLGPFPESDADLPLGDSVFTCITTLRRPNRSYADVQLQSAQVRFADILKQRAPDEWEDAPIIDIDRATSTWPNAGPGTFPMLDMFKVDMTAYNANKPFSERCQLVIYRLHKPIPADDANAHVLCHAFEADRNGLLMVGNHLGWGYNLGPAASLSYAFYMHTNADEAIFNDGKWWIQEVCWPRACSGRATLESRIWSPEGKHIASGYQDGLCMPMIDKSKL